MKPEPLPLPDEEPEPLPDDELEPRPLPDEEPKDARPPFPWRVAAGTAAVFVAGVATLACRPNDIFEAFVIFGCMALGILFAYLVAPV